MERLLTLLLVNFHMALELWLHSLVTKILSWLVILVEHVLVMGVMFKDIGLVF